MICPHCSRNLLRKQRAGKRCSYCRKKFVFDPKVNRLGLHDVRVQKLATKLSDDGRLRFAVTQLWYAAGRKSLESRHIAGGGCFLLSGFVLLPLMLGIFGDGVSGFRIVLTVAAILAWAVLLVRASRRKRGAVPMPLERFRLNILAEWVQIHGSGVTGLVDEQVVAAPVIPNPRVGLVCPDRAVVTCLAVNGILEQEEMIAVPIPDALPPGLPAVILHDASPAGVRFAGDAATVLAGRRVVAAGLRPRTVLKAKAAVVLHQRKLDSSAVASLRSSGLEPAEIDWLASGSWSPVVALPPARIIAMVRRAALRVTGVSNVERQQAKHIGFLSWPAAG